ncbi:MAG: OmpA family protein [Kineosporiaceae bacterium]
MVPPRFRSLASIGIAASLCAAMIAGVGPANALPTAGSTLSVTRAGAVPGATVINVGGDRMRLGYENGRIDGETSPAAGATGAVTGLSGDEEQLGNHLVSYYLVSHATAHQVVAAGWYLGWMARVVAGNGQAGAVVPGPALDTPLTPGALAQSKDGWYVADLATGVVAKVAGSTLRVVAGIGTRGVPVLVPSIAATSTPFDKITGLAVDHQGNLYIGDGGSACITRLDALTGALSLVAGQCGMPGTPVAGRATASPLGHFGGIALDRYGALYIADTGSHYVEKVNLANDTLSLFAGTGDAGDLVPGPATSSPITPLAVAVRSSMDVYVIQDSGDSLAMIANHSSVPGEPLLYAGDRGRDGCVHIFIRQDEDGGSPVMRYESSLDGSTWVNSPWHPDRYGHGTAQVCGLSIALPYTILLRAVNSIGTGSEGSVFVSPLPGPLTPRPPLSPPTPSEWFTDPLSPAARTRLVAIPRRPNAYRGKPLRTKALHRAYRDQIAVPVASVGGRALAAGQAVSLSGDTPFGYNSARITADGRAQIRALATSLKGARSIVCEGYTDHGGSIPREKRLSLDRARAVCAALTADGVIAAVTSLGYGEQRPVIIGGKATQRAENRRVVVLVRR